MPLSCALDWQSERLPGVPTIHVTSNHDFWWDRYTLTDQVSRGRDVAIRHGIQLLMDAAVIIGGTRFAGGTVWTNFRFGSTTLTEAMRSAEGRLGMVDYRRIHTGPSSRHRIEPGEILALHRRTRTFAEATLSSTPMPTNCFLQR
ncbi:hypothetical protein ACLBXJ_22395 [Methylobacterium mesophilicum]